MTRVTGTVLSLVTFTFITLAASVAAAQPAETSLHGVVTRGLQADPDTQLGWAAGGFSSPQPETPLTPGEVYP